MIEETSAPPIAHPILGLGGRSIELSVALGRTPDPRAFQLAVQILHEHVEARDCPAEVARQAASWLRELPAYTEMPVTAREMLIETATELNRA
jgi:hypothetical protein